MQKLFEAWNKFLTEDEKDYFPWLTALQSLEDPDREAVEKAFPEWELLGVGSYRAVMSPKGEEDYIIKVIHDKRDAYQNEMEFEVSRDFPTLFPKAFAHHPKYNWIVLEKVKVIESLNMEFRRAFEAAFPKVTKYASDAGVKNFFLTFKSVLYAAALGADPDAEDDISPAQMENIKKIRDFGLEESEPFRELVKAIATYKIDISDISVGNIGINDEGKFIIIDSSIWEA